MPVDVPHQAPLPWRLTTPRTGHGQSPAGDLTIPVVVQRDNVVDHSGTTFARASKVAKKPPQ